MILRAPASLALLTSLFCSFCVVSGCNKPKPAPPAEQARVEYLYHTVSFPGETLAAVAKWYTGSSSSWQTIRDHNPGLDVRRLRIGTMISIPKTIVRNQRPMPRTALAKASLPNSTASTNASGATASTNTNTDAATVKPENGNSEGAPQGALAQQVPAEEPEVGRIVLQGEPAAGPPAESARGQTGAQDEAMLGRLADEDQKAIAAPADAANQNGAAANSASSNIGAPADPSAGETAPDLVDNTASNGADAAAENDPKTPKTKGDIIHDLLNKVR